MYWNLHISTYADERFRIENQLNQLLDSVQSAVKSFNIGRSNMRGFRIPLKSRQKVKPISKNHKEHLRYNISDIHKELSNLLEVIDKLQSSSLKYGYTSI